MHRWNSIVTVSFLVLSGTWANGQLRLPSYSLDDNPSMPLISNPGIGLGAEDPFGLGTFGASPGAPSPSLFTPTQPPFMDADLVTPNPGVGGVQLDTGMSVIFGGATTYIDAVSTNNFQGATAGSVHMVFSVDRVTTGSPFSNVNAQTNLNQQPGDVYHSVMSFAHPTNFVGTPVVAGFNGNLPPAMSGPGGNTLLADESILGLTVTGTPGAATALNVVAPPIAPGTHDNIDAIELSDFDLNGDFISDQVMYFTTGPDDINGLPGAFIVHIPGNTPPTVANASIYATPGQMGLNTFTDNIDGLVVWNVIDATENVAVPGQDFALFSLSHGSSSLGPGMSEADVFFTDFRGGFWRFASAASLGLAGANDNIDAMDIVIPGDANLDGFVDGADFAALLPNLFTPAPPQLGWLLGNFDSSPIIDAADFLIWSANNFSAQSPLAPVPEPQGMVLMLVALVAARRRSAT